MQETKRWDAACPDGALFKRPPLPHLSAWCRGAVRAQEFTRGSARLSRADRARVD